MIRHLQFARAVAALLFATLVCAGPAAATNIERVTSPGGIEAWLVHEPAVPIIALHFSFKGGADQDPALKPGLGYMAAALLDDGAGELDAEAFQRRLQEHAVEMRFAVTRDDLSGSVRLLRDRKDQGFELLRLALTEPRFDSAAVERVRAQMISALRRETTNPNDIASRIWWETAFPNHPYGRPTNGTLESVPLITPEDLRGFVRRVLARDRLKIAAVGDIDAPTLGRVLDEVFGKLPAHAELTAVPRTTLQGIGRRIVVDLDVPQAVLSLGGVGIERKDPDFIPAYIVNHVLGGGSFSSRLYNEVREKRGLAYGVYSYLASLDYTALFLGGTQTRADRTGDALALIEAEIARMAKDGPTADELAKAKSYLKGSYPLSFDTSGKIASQLLRIQLDDLGIDYINKRNSLIEAVTLDDAKRAAKRLAAGGLFVTVVGRPKGLASKEPGG
jgi:zinc protease